LPEKIDEAAERLVSVAVQPLFKLVAEPILCPRRLSSGGSHVQAHLAHRYCRRCCHRPTREVVDQTLPETLADLGQVIEIAPASLVVAAAVVSPPSPWRRC
jgi:hypothetical protein